MSRQKKVRADAGRGRLLRCEWLEDRRLLAVFTVDTVDDLVSVTPSPFLSLRMAVAAANAIPGADEIRFDPALFAGGPRTMLLTKGELTVTDSLTVTGPGAGLLTIDASGSDPTPEIVKGDGKRAFSLWTNEGPAPLVHAITGLTFIGGDVATDGGAILNYGYLTIDACMFRGNSARSGGGAVSVSSAGIPKLTVLNSRFEDNTSLFYGGAIDTKRQLVIENSTFVHNSSREGGAVSTQVSASGTISNSTFLRNTATFAGGSVSWGGGDLRVAHSDFSGNSIETNALFGGGLILRGNVAIVDSAFRGLRANTGGGIYVHNGATTIAGSIIEGNLASQRGGGIAANAILKVTSSQILENRAVGSGGGISGGDVLVELSEIARNIAGANNLPKPTESFQRGGGISANRVEIRGSTVIDNKAGGDGGGIAAGRVVVAGAAMLGNHAALDGGAVWIDGLTSESLSQIEATYFADNSADGNGGGIAFRGEVARLFVTNTTLDRNHTDGYGGGFYGNSSRSTIEAPLIVIRQTTITANTADFDREGEGGGGGLFLRSGAAEISNTVVAMNNDNHGIAPDLGGFLGAAYDPHFSLIGTQRGSGLVEAELGSPDAQGNLIGGPIHGAIDPMLGPLADNGGPSLPGGVELLTRAPLPGSPLIDAGNPTFAPGVGGASEFDGRGALYTRLAGERVDIGAVEVQNSGGTYSADFNLDSRVDGSDFLAWQRGVGRTSGVTIRQGDATANGAVDENDLAVWRARAEQHAAGVANEAADAVFAAGDFTVGFLAGVRPKAARGRVR